MSLPFAPPPYRSSERVAHLCPNDALRYNGVKSFDSPSKYQQRPELTAADRQAYAQQAQKVRQTPTYESRIYTRQEATHISPRKGTAQGMRDNLDSVSVSTKQSDYLSTLPRNVYKPASKVPTGALPSDMQMPRQPMAYKGSFDPNRHGKKDFLECEVKSVSEPFKVKHGQPEKYLPPNPRHQPHNVKYEKPNDHVVTLQVSNVSEKVKMKDVVRRIAADGQVVMDYNLENNVVTNKRTGGGIIHVRAKNEQDLNAITGTLEAQGMTVAVKSDYKPVWKR